MRNEHCQGTDFLLGSMGKLGSQEPGWGAGLCLLPVGQVLERPQLRDGKPGTEQATTHPRPRLLFECGQATLTSVILSFPI